MIKRRLAVGFVFFVLAVCGEAGLCPDLAGQETERCPGCEKYAVFQSARLAPARKDPVPSFSEADLSTDGRAWAARQSRILTPASASLLLLHCVFRI